MVLNDLKMGCMADYDEDCNGEKPEGCMCQQCCEQRDDFIKCETKTNTEETDLKLVGSCLPHNQ